MSKFEGEPKDEKKAKSRSRSRSNDDKKEENVKFRELKWVLPGIIVRVVSKKVENGKLYNKKLRVIDVLNKCQFSATPIEN